MSQTPIYDQLRGERINADVPATGNEPQHADHAGKQRLPTGGPGPAAVFTRGQPGQGHEPLHNDRTPPRTAAPVGQVGSRRG
ncbi:MAG: hypothetical protein M3302_07130 [Actinomycetota bacterium]|nr:hypothetical protein [Actinomycetota bacterium]